MSKSENPDQKAHHRRGVRYAPTNLIRLLAILRATYLLGAFLASEGSNYMYSRTSMTRTPLGP